MSVSATHQILWLEDNENDVFIFGRKLKQAGLLAEISHVETGQEFEEALANGDWDMILSDYDLPDFTPMEALKLLEESGRDIPFIIVSGAVSAEESVRLMKAGAHDFVAKDEVARLVPAIEREIKDRDVRRDRVKTRSELEVRNRELAETLQKLREAQDDALRLQRIRAVGEMASGVAHDFNNCLMKIAGLASVIGDDLGKDICLDKHAENLETIKDAADQGKQIIKRVAKFYNANAHLEAESVELSDLIKTVATDVFSSIEKRKIGNEIFLKWDLKEIPNVQTKEEDFLDAFRNLVLNGIEAMPDGGNLTISTAPADDDRILLSISDTGTGMSKEVLRRCLEPFYSTKGEFSTGLGLGVADAVIQQYGGTLSIESERWNGTTVNVILRAAESKAASGPSKLEFEKVTCDWASEPVTEAAPLRILIAEDEKLIGKLVQRFLEADNHTVTLTANGNEALRVFDPNSFDLVISDRSMPEVSGDELAAKIAEKAAWIPVILMTGFGDIMIARGEKPEGVHLILPKPVDQVALRDSIATTIAQFASAQRLAS